MLLNCSQYIFISIFFLNRPLVAYIHAHTWYLENLIINNILVLLLSSQKSGDHDLFVPHFSTLKWIKSINLLLVEDWRPWYVDKQIAGLVMFSLGSHA